jgi:hypothetical protein
MTKRRTAALLVVAASITLAGCGDSDNGVADLAADEIVAEVLEAAEAAESVQVTGEMEVDGEGLAFDMGFTAGGATGTLTFEGADIELLSVDGDVYMRGDADAWTTMTGNPSAGALLANRYALLPADDASFEDFAAFTDLAGFVDELMTTEGSVSKGDEAEIGGQKVIGLISDDEGGTLYVATTGDPLPIQLAAPEGETGSLDFDWDATVEVAAPDDEDVIDLTEFM